MRSSLFWDFTLLNIKEAPQDPNQLMLYSELIAPSSQLHMKDVNALCRQKVKRLNVKPGGTYNKR
jgi:hypothetical protein